MKTKRLAILFACSILCAFLSGTAAIMSILWNLPESDEDYGSNLVDYLSHPTYFSFWIVIVCSGAILGFLIMSPTLWGTRLQSSIPLVMASTVITAGCTGWVLYFYSAVPSFLAGLAAMILSRIWFMEDPMEMAIKQSWGTLRTHFLEDDGSLPEVELTNLTPQEIAAVFSRLWDRAEWDSESLASYHHRETEEDRTIHHPASVAKLVCNGEANSVHVLLKGLSHEGHTIPDLGVFVHPDSIELDYRKGSGWGVTQLAGLFDLLYEVTIIAPRVKLRSFGCGKEFAKAWIHYAYTRKAYSSERLKPLSTSHPVYP